MIYRNCLSFVQIGDIPPEFKPTVLTPEQAREAEEKNLRVRGLTEGEGSDILEGKSKEYNAIVEAFSTFTDSDKIVDSVIENHMGLGEFSPQGMKEMLENAGYTTKPLNKSSTWKGVPFEEGGGYKINFGGDAYFQYHPEEGSHHNGAYWKVSNGKHGKIRYNLDGTIDKE